MSEIIFRRAVLSDIPKFVELRQQQLQEEGAIPNMDISDALNEYFEKNMGCENFVSWLAICDHEIIATSGMSFSQKPPHYGNISGYIGTLSCMYTIKQYRRQGIAKKLLGLVVNEATERGCSQVNITASNMGKLLYHSFGFTEKSNYMVYNITK